MDLADKNVRHLLIIFMSSNIEENLNMMKKEAVSNSN